MRHLLGNMFGVSGFGANDSTACQTEDVDGWTKSSHDNCVIKILGLAASGLW